MSTEKKNPIIRYLDPTSCGLPEDWIVEEKQRNISASNKYDRYYYEPGTGRKFRSLKLVLEHLQGTKTDDGQNLKESPNLKSSSSSRIEMKRTKTVMSSPKTLNLQDNIEGTSSMIEERGKGKTVVPLSKMEDKLLAYVCSVKLDASEILVQCDEWCGKRSDLKTLMPRKWIDDAIINVIVYQLNIKEEEYMGYRLIRSYLPTIFGSCAGGVNININKVLEVYTSKYISTAELSSKIFIPLNDIDNWFLCIIDLQQEEVYILDSLPCKTREKERTDMVKSIIGILCLTNLAKYNLHDFPLSRPDWVPQQENSWDSGLYVIRFMQELDTIPPVDGSNLKVDNSNNFRRKLVFDLILDDNNRAKQHILSQLNEKP